MLGVLVLVLGLLVVFPVVGIVTRRWLAVLVARGLASRSGRTPVGDRRPLRES